MLQLLFTILVDGLIYGSYLFIVAVGMTSIKVVGKPGPPAVRSNDFTRKFIIVVDHLINIESIREDVDSFFGNHITVNVFAF